MPNKQRTTFQKRQKELARQEKRRKKIERRTERKVLKAQRGPDQDLAGVEAPGTLPHQAAAGEDSEGSAA